MMKQVVLVAVIVACSSKQGPSTTGSGSGALPPATGCDGAKAKVERLYRTEAAARSEKPERIAEAVADNTHMVMNECVMAPDKVVACITRVATAAELEQRCLAPLDEEGTEGEALRRGEP